MTEFPHVFLLIQSVLITGNLISANIDPNTLLSPSLQWTTSRCPATGFSTACMFLGLTRASMWRGTSMLHLLTRQPSRSRDPVHHAPAADPAPRDPDPAPFPLQTEASAGQVFSRLLSSVSCCLPGAPHQQIQQLLHLQQPRSQRPSRFCSTTPPVQPASASKHHHPLTLPNSGCVFCSPSSRSSRPGWRCLSSRPELGEVSGGDHGPGGVRHEVHSSASCHGGRSSPASRAGFLLGTLRKRVRATARKQY